MSRKAIELERIQIPVVPLEPILRTHLLMAADAYCEATGYSQSSIGLWALQNGRLFSSMLAGSTLKLRNYDKLMAYIAKQWPKGVYFPTVDDAKKSLEASNGKAAKATKARKKQ